MTVFTGTSGWQYRDWQGRFYPEKLPVREWLGHFSRCFQTVEVNNTFYKLPEVDTFEDWERSVPVDFLFSLKFSRFLTHIKRLKDPAEPVERFISHSSPLKGRLGAVLLQLPADMPVSTDRLAETLEYFPKDVRVAVEFRNKGWLRDDVLDLLTGHGAALCLSDRGSRPVTPLVRTADWGYIRLHGGRSSPRPCYGRSALDSWAMRIADLWPQDEDVYLYFNNDTNACAVRDAHLMGLACSRHGLNVSRLPGARDFRLHA